MDNSIYPVTKATEFLKEVKNITKHIYIIMDYENMIKMLDSRSTFINEYINKIENEKDTISYLMRELPFLTSEDMEGMEGWIRGEILDYRICPYCHGTIGCYPKSEFNYEVSCEKCGEIFDEN